MPHISPRWPGNGQNQEQDAWCWAATTSTLIDCFGAGARPQAQIVHEWLMSAAAPAEDEIVNNYRAWIESFGILPPTWAGVQARVNASPEATQLMNLASGNSLPGVIMEHEDLGAHDVATIGALLLSGVLYVLGSADHWYILYGADEDTGDLLIWNPAAGAGAETHDLAWLQNLDCFLVTGYNVP